MKAFIFPGQGSQFKGMGQELFHRYPEYSDVASNILGYSISELCVLDPNKQLNQTLYTQPALYVVNALSYLQIKEFDDQAPDIVAGHSLGEYNALLAAEVYSFERGLELVKERARLMAKAEGGGMAVILGVQAAEISELITESGLSDVELANLNTLEQNVVAGDKQQLAQFERLVQDSDCCFIPLPVSGAFHSKAMENAKREYLEHLKGVEFSWIRIPVVSNVEARPYQQSKIKTLLSGQITSSVRWRDSIKFMRSTGVGSIIEVGPGDVLTNMASKIDMEGSALA